ncbi:MAG: DNA methylase [Planctomycetes bacterium]|nr:DNA methylase [Planctomycetota bacterium]
MPKPFFDHDGVTIFHGDCQSVLPAMPAESVDFVLTDPPYLVRYKGRWELGQEHIVGDDDPSWLLPSFAEIYRVLRPDSFCVSFYGWPHSDLFVGVWKALGFRVVSHFAFVKRVWGLGRFTRSQHETAFLLAKGRPRPPETGISDVIEWQREADAVHPNQKPTDALYPLLSAFARERGCVLDPFMGSGSTLRAAKDFGLRAIGIEIEKKYCVAAVQRMAQGVLFPLPLAPAAESPEIDSFLDLSQEK